MKPQLPLLSAALLLTMTALPAAAADDHEVNIKRGLPSVEVEHDDRTVTIRRDQDPDATIDPRYAKTSRACPPFCIQPMQLAPGVETIGELEMLDYLQQASRGDDVIVIDSRTPDWVEKGTIPGSINVPWTQLDPGQGADPFTIADYLARFGVDEQEGLWDFSGAKTLVLFCNGMWCGQSPANIRTLLEFGYPADRIKWYRGGMQAWHVLGLTTVTPDGEIID